MNSCCNCKALKSEAWVCMQGGEQLAGRQEGGQGQRAGTLPQRPSRLDPKGDRGRQLNQGALPLRMTLNMPGWPVTCMQ
jgi:hypothetical protein